MMLSIQQRKLAASLLIIAMATGCDISFHGAHVTVGGRSIQFDFQGETAIQEDAGEIPAGTGILDLHNQFGDVDVKVTDGTPTWSWRVKCWADQVEQAEQLAKLCTLETIQDGDTFRCKFVVPDGVTEELRGVKSDLTLHVRKGWSVVLDNEHGKSQVTGTQAPLRVRQRHGDLSASDIGDTDVEIAHGKTMLGHVSGTLALQSRHGNVQLSRLDDIANVELSHAQLNADVCHSDVSVNATHGDATFNLVGGELRFEGSHGGISAADVAGPVVANVAHDQIQLSTNARRVDCRSRHGNINVQLTNREINHLDIDATHGNIELVFPSGMQPAIDASAEHGKLRSHFGIQPNTGLKVRTRHGNIQIMSASP